MAIIVASNIWKRFDTKDVLKGLNLEVEEGETLVILGRSGVGKSVLLRLIIGMDKPDAGTISVGEFCISDLSGPRLYKAIRNVGMLFQGSALFDSMTVGENTGFYLRQHRQRDTHQRMPEEEVRKRVADALAMVDLEGTEDVMPDSLSGGMRKRVALARLIAYRPSVILYDEPTTGLDPITAKQICRLIRRTQQELHTTSVVVTHDLLFALEVGDRLALHYDGQIALVAEPEKFLKSDHSMVRTFLENIGPVGADIAAHWSRE